MDATANQNPMSRMMSLRDFRLLFDGSATSLLDDQFTLIATPWLVLKLTGDPLALGIVLALEGLPRAIFMLAGSGLVPISQAISGAFIKWTLETLFVSAGVLILLVVLWAASQPGLKVFSEGLAAEMKL
jgi:hypothetical protein